MARITRTSGLTQSDRDNLLEVHDHTQEVLEEINTAIMRGLEKIGLAAEGYAKRLVHVDTGRLRNSITHDLIPDENAVIIGTNVEYAEIEETRGRDSKGETAYLRPAARDHLEEYKRILEKELDNT